MTPRLAFGFRSEGAKVAVRAPRPSDVARLAWIRRRSWPALQPWSPARASGRSWLDEAREAVRNDRRAWSADRGYAFVITARDDDALVGRVALNQVARGVFDNAYLGYWIDAAHAGRGWTTEAVRLVLDAAFGPLGLHRVQAAIIPGNEPSLALARRVGFRREGTAERYLRIAGAWRDHWIFAMTREEWDRVARTATHSHSNRRGSARRAR